MIYESLAISDVGLAGDVEAFGLADTIRMLAWTKKTGVLLVENGAEQGLLFVSNGEIVAAEETDDKSRKLSEALIDGGYMPQQTVLPLVSDLWHDSMAVGDVLLKHNVIGPGFLNFFLRLQILEVATHLFIWSEGQYFFKNGVVHPKEGIAVRLKAEELVREADRAAIELEKLQKKGLSLDSTVVTRETKPDTFAISDFSPVERKVLDLARGRPTIRSIAHCLFLSEVQAGKAVDLLSSEGLVTVRPPIHSLI